MPDRGHPAGPTEAPRFGLFIEVAPNALLPATCPRCIAPGVKAWPVPTWRGLRPTEETSFYCEECTARLERGQTRQLATAVAAALLTSTLVVTLCLYWGAVHRLEQLASVLLIATVAEGCAWAIWAWTRPHEGIVRIEHATRRLYWVARSDYAATLSGKEVPLPRSRPPWQRPPRSLGLAAVTGVLLWSSIQLFGTASVRVVVGNDRDAVLLVDARHRATLRASADENPHSGALEAVMGGGRVLSLYGTAGQLIAETETVIWPGRDYLFGHLPPGNCLYVEERAYGQAGSTHLLHPLAGNGPVWELDVPVDQWFAALPERSELPTTGGRRRAVRLLPCR